MECAEVTYCSASAVSSGKPTTPPSALSASEGMSARAGRGWRSASSMARASNAAMLARAQVRKVGSRSATATRVAGSDPAKIATPMNPLIHPLLVLSIKSSLVCSRQWAIARPDLP